MTSVGGFDCSADSTIVFNDTVANLIFQVTGGSTGDSAVAEIFDGNTFLHSIPYSSDILVDFTGWSNITSLFINDLGSTGFGFVYGAFTFDESQGPDPDPGTVPTPATLGTGAIRATGDSFGRSKSRQTAAVHAERFVPSSKIEIF